MIIPSRPADTMPRRRTAEDVAVTDSAAPLPPRVDIAFERDNECERRQSACVRAVEIRR